MLQCLLWNPSEGASTSPAAVSDSRASALTHSPQDCEEYYWQTHLEKLICCPASGWSTGLRGSPASFYSSLFRKKKLQHVASWPGMWHVCPTQFGLFQLFATSGLCEHQNPDKIHTPLATIGQHGENFTRQKKILDFVWKCLSWLFWAPLKAELCNHSHCSCRLPCSHSRLSPGRGPPGKGCPPLWASQGWMALDWRYYIPCSVCNLPVTLGSRTKTLHFWKMSLESVSWIASAVQIAKWDGGVWRGWALEWGVSSPGEKGLGFLEI